MATRKTTLVYRFILAIMFERWLQLVSMTLQQGHAPISRWVFSVCPIQGSGKVAALARRFETSWRHRVRAAISWPANSQDQWDEYRMVLWLRSRMIIPTYCDHVGLISDWHHISMLFIVGFWLGFFHSWKWTIWFSKTIFILERL